MPPTSRPALLRRVVLGVALTVTAVTATSPGLAWARPITSIPETRQPWLWPFSADSPWNLGVGSEAQFEPADAPKTRALLDDDAWPWINVEEYSHPVLRATWDDPVATVHVRSGGTRHYRMPEGATAAAGTDQHLHVVDPTGRWVNEAWNVEGGEAGHYARIDLRSSGMGEGGTRAYGGSAIGGLIRRWELQVGNIRHALALALTDEQLGRGPVWPATTEDGNAGSTYSGVIPMGTYVAIPPGVDLTTLGLSREGLAVARALQRYGAYVVDRSGSFTFFGEPGIRKDVVARVRADIRRIRPHLRVVANNGPDRVNGGGEHRAPMAPAFRG